MITKELIEAMEILKGFDCGDKSSLSEAIRGVEVELQRQRERQAVPSGWKLVPIEPTDNMLDDGHEALDDRHHTGRFGECPGLKWSDAKACYQAMLAAAPSPELVAPKLHAASYEHNGKQYAITLEGCHEEVHAHAMRLGLTIDGVIVEQISSTRVD
jgi:hypothetical protein